MSNTLTDRRRETRVDLCVPLKFRAIADPQSGEQAAESINLSQRGMCVSTSYPLTIGTEVEVFLKMPQELTGKPASEVRCTARVVHVQRAALSPRSEVGLRVERYEPAAAVRERWAS
jgi:hypothetical protein